MRHFESAVWSVTSSGLCRFLWCTVENVKVTASLRKAVMRAPCFGKMEVLSLEAALVTPLQDLGRLRATSRRMYFV